MTGATASRPTDGAPSAAGLRRPDRRHEPTGQEQGERAALTGCAVQLDLAAEEAGQLAADGEPESGAAVLAAGAAVGLLEGLEDDLLLVGGDADARVGHREGDDEFLGAQVLALVAQCPGRPAADGEGHPPVARELEGVGQEILQNLLEPLDVGLDGAGQIAVARSMPKRRFFDSATWLKVRSTKACSSAKRSSPTSTTTVPDSIFDRSRMSLMRLSRSLPDE